MKNIGAIFDKNITKKNIISQSSNCTFRVWAPFAKEVTLCLTANLTQNKKNIKMTSDDKGYFSVYVKDLPWQSEYCYQINKDKKIADPASSFQAKGVFAPSVAYNDDFKWTNKKWKGIAWEKYIIYELHVGTFTKNGTFQDIIPLLKTLKDLGITAIELMPIAQCSGLRNWGYDAVFPFAVQNNYGGPYQLKNLINECHKIGLAVILDVIYNHLGPEGNFLNHFGPYFTKKYHTPWGDAINYDDAYSDEVRSFFIQNALYWFEEFQVDALRLDAIQMIYDFSATHFLKELSLKVQELQKKLQRKIYLIAESDLNDVKIIHPYKKGGYGLKAQWSDDFHHSIHAYLTKEQNGYYKDFGKKQDIQSAFQRGYVYAGKYSSFRKRTYGNYPEGIQKNQFVVCCQNHDQIGNRMLGERLSTLLSFDDLKLCASLLILSPFTPLLFMGEEYGEENPFLYFVNHSDKNLIKAVREGRKSEFKEFSWKGNVPDPQSEKTFLKSKIKLTEKLSQLNPKQLLIRELYKKLIHIRKKYNFSSARNNWQSQLIEGQKLLLVFSKTRNIFIIHNLTSNKQNLSSTFLSDCLDGDYNDYKNYIDKMTGTGEIILDTFEDFSLKQIKAMDVYNVNIIRAIPKVKKIDITKGVINKNINIILNPKTTIIIKI